MLLSVLPFLSEKSTLVLKTVTEACDYALANVSENLVCSCIIVVVNNDTDSTCTSIQDYE